VIADIARHRILNPVQTITAMSADSGDRRIFGELKPADLNRRISIQLTFPESAVPSQPNGPARPS
jgi:hypothetical protein